MPITLDTTNWLNAFPADSIRRLRNINKAANSSTHIILALTYALTDRNIQRLNRLIIGLLLSRLKAERNCQTERIERINRLLQDIHEGIDRLTGVSKEVSEDQLCKSPKLVRAGAPLVVSKAS